MKAPVVATISGAWHCGGVRFTARLTDGRERWLAGTRIVANLHATPDSDRSSAHRSTANTYERSLVHLRSLCIGHGAGPLTLLALRQPVFSHESVDSRV